MDGRRGDRRARAHLRGGGEGGARVGEGGRRRWLREAVTQGGYARHLQRRVLGVRPHARHHSRRRQLRGAQLAASSSAAASSSSSAAASSAAADEAPDNAAAAALAPAALAPAPALALASLATLAAPVPTLDAGRAPTRRARRARAQIGAISRAELAISRPELPISRAELAISRREAADGDAVDRGESEARVLLRGVRLG